MLYLFNQKSLTYIFILRNVYLTYFIYLIYILNLSKSNQPILSTYPQTLREM